jgi:5-methylcytosine-specific restriction endonuclease McrA
MEPVYDLHVEGEPGSGDRRARIFRRAGFRCVYCGEVFPPDRLTVDHVQPRMRGGDPSDGNLVCACGACNVAKGGQPAWAFLAARPVQRANFLRYAHGVWPRLIRAVVEAAERTRSG